MQEDKEHAEIESITDRTNEKKRLTVEANEAEGAIVHLENTKNSIPAEQRKLKDSLKERRLEYKDLRESKFRVRNRFKLLATDNLSFTNQQYFETVKVY